MITDKEIEKIFEWADEFNLKGKRYNQYKWGIDIDLEKEEVRGGIPRDKELLLQLTHINLRSAKLTYIPKEFCKLKNLKWLDLYWNNLVDLPDNFSELENLEWLDLSHNEISSIEMLPISLKILHLYSNNLHKVLVGKEFQKLENLELLNLRYNQIVKIDNYLPKNLKKLFLNGNKIKEINQELLELNKLEWLDLSYNNLKIIKNLPKNLETIYLNSNKIEEISEDFKNLDKLKFLNLECNNIKKVQNLPKNLEIIYLNNNGIEEISEDFKNLDKLSILNLKYNNIENIENLPKNLYELELNDNKLKNIDILHEFKFLKFLDISGIKNKEALKNFTSQTLKQLTIDNEIFIPKDIAKKCPNIGLIEIDECEDRIDDIEEMDFYKVGWNIGVLVRTPNIEKETLLQMETTQPKHQKPFKNFLYKGE